VIVFQIDVDSIALDPTERDTPVAGGADSIAALVATNERVKTKPGRFMSSGRDASSSARRMFATRFVF